MGNNIIESIKQIKLRQLILPIILFVVFLGTVIGIINYQQKVKETSAPIIEITKPKDEETLNNTGIIVEGKTTPNSKVTINGNDVTANNLGQFKKETILTDGLNEIKVVSNAPNGKIAVKTINVTVNTQSITNPNPENQANQTQATTDMPVNTENQNLNSTGPEDFWIIEALALSGVGAVWYVSRKKLSDSIKK